MAARVEVEGAEELLRRLKAIGEPRPLLRALQLQTVREAKLLVPRKTGNLGRSIVPGSITGNSAEVHATANYAAFVEYGTRPHIIKPKKGRALSWPANASGRRLSGRARVNSGPRIFAKLVHHPGTKAQPFLLKGAEAALSKGGFRDSVTKQWNDAA